MIVMFLIGLSSVLLFLWLLSLCQEGLIYVVTHLVYQLPILTCLVWSGWFVWHVHEMTVTVWVTTCINMPSKTVKQYKSYITYKYSVSTVSMLLALLVFNWISKSSSSFLSSGESIYFCCSNSHGYKTKMSNQYFYPATLGIKISALGKDNTVCLRSTLDTAT